MEPKSKTGLSNGETHWREFLNFQRTYNWIRARDATTLDIGDETSSHFGGSNCKVRRRAVDTNSLKRYTAHGIVVNFVTAFSRFGLESIGIVCCYKFTTCVLWWPIIDSTYTQTSV